MLKIKKAIEQLCNIISSTIKQEASRNVYVVRLEISAEHSCIALSSDDIISSLDKQTHLNICDYDLNS